MEQKIDKLRSLILERLPQDQIAETGVEGVTIYRRDHPYEKKPLIYKPQIIIMAQGRKNIYLGGEKYTYDENHYFVQTLPLPVECEALIEEGKPMLGMAIKIDPQIIGEMLFGMDSEPHKNNQIPISIYSAELTDSILDASIRLLESLKSKNETKILGKLYHKEILFRVLNGENGEVLKELVYNNRGLYQISRIISTIHKNYTKPINIQELANEAGMSASAFHTSFKAVTTTSPLQYIKNIRLHKTKELIQQEGEKAYSAAIKVGYESTSQFNREYKRCFGFTPAKDRTDASRY